MSDRSIGLVVLAATLGLIAWSADFKLTVRHELALTCKECGLDVEISGEK